jgi:desert hedgehog protein
MRRKTSECGFGTLRTRWHVALFLVAMALATPLSAASAAGGIDQTLQRLGLAPMSEQAADRPADVQSVVLTRLGETRSTIGRCLAFLGRHFKNAPVDAILKDIPQKPGQSDAVTEETFARIQRATNGADGISRRDLDECVRLVDMPIGGRIDYVRSLAQIDRSIYKCTKVLNTGVPSHATIEVLATLQRQPGSSSYTKPDTLGALDRAFGRPTGLTRLDLDTCAAAYNVDANLLARSEIVAGLTGGCSAGQSYCQGTMPGYVCCGGSQPVCAQSCDEDGDCEPYCMPSLSCFPGDATVVMEGGGTRRIAEVRIGDRVQVAHADGSLGFEDVYLLTHQDAATTRTYIRLTLDSGRSLVLSPRHFIPRAGDGSTRWDDRVVVGADEVRSGDRVWYVADDGSRQLARVGATAAEAATGAFNPLTMQGTIIVDGVVASAHSDWFLDGYVAADTQAKVYQAILAPVRGLYRIIGPEWTRTIAEDLGVVDMARAGTSSLGRTAAWTGGALLLVLALAVPLLVRRRRLAAL